MPRSATVRPDTGTHGLHHFLNWTNQHPDISYQIVRTAPAAPSVMFVVDTLTELAAVAQAIGGAWLLFGKVAPTGKLAGLRGIAWGLEVEIISRESVPA